MKKQAGLTARSISFLCMSFLCLTTVSAQNLQWVENLPIQSAGHDITLDASGNVYICGQFTGLHDFDPGPGTFYMEANGGIDGFVCKYNAAGVFQWGARMGGQTTDIAHGVAVDAAGNVFVAGEFFGTAVFGTGAQTVLYGISATSIDLFVSKYDASGNFQWVKGIGSDATDIAHAVDVTPAGDVVVAGELGGSADVDPGIAFDTRATHSNSTDAFFWKLDASGNFVWMNLLAGEFKEVCNAIDIDQDGNIYIAGSFEGIADFDPAAGFGFAPLSSAGGSDVFIGKYTPAGKYRWATKAGGTQDDAAFGVRADKSGKVYGTGFFKGTADFDGSTATYNLTSVANTTDIFVYKADSSGSFNWARAMGGSSTEQGFSIDADDSGNVYTTGHFMQTVDFDPGAATYNLTSAGSATDLFASKLNTSGDFVWALKLGSTGNDRGTGVKIGTAPGLYLSGFYRETVDFDPSPTDSFKLSSPGAQSGFLLKLSSCPVPSLSGGISGPASSCAGSLNTFTVVPGFGTYTWTLPAGWSGASGSNSINVTTGSSNGIMSVRVANTCGQSAPLNLNVQSKALPNVQLDMSAIDTQCSNVSSVTLTGGSPLGGTYSGTAVTGGSFSPSTAGVGNYLITYVYMAGNGCSDSSSANIHVKVCTGVGTSPLAAKESFAVFPNPFHHDITVRVPGPEGARFNLYNVQGLCLGQWNLSGDESSLDLSYLSAGVYLLQMITAEGTVQQRLLKK